MYPDRGVGEDGQASLDPVSAVNTTIPRRQRNVARPDRTVAVEPIESFVLVEHRDRVETRVLHFQIILVTLARGLFNCVRPQLPMTQTRHAGDQIQVDVVKKMLPVRFDDANVAVKIDGDATRKSTVGARI